MDQDTAHRIATALESIAGSMERIANPVQTIEPDTSPAERLERLTAWAVPAGYAGGGGDDVVPMINKAEAMEALRR